LNQAPELINEPDWTFKTVIAYGTYASAIRAKEMAERVAGQMPEYFVTQGRGIDEESRVVRADDQQNEQQ
jgi:hypothetical protein